MAGPRLSPIISTHSSPISSADSSPSWRASWKRVSKRWKAIWRTTVLMPVLDLAGQQAATLGGRRLGQQLLEHQALAEDRGGLGQRQRRVGQQGAQRLAQGLVDGVAQLVGQGQHVAPLAHVVHEHVGVAVGGDRMGVGAGLLAGAGPRVDPRAGRRRSGPWSANFGARAEKLSSTIALGLVPGEGPRRGRRRAGSCGPSGRGPCGPSTLAFSR